VLLRSGSLEGVAVASVTFRGFGSGDETGVVEARLYRDGNGDGKWDAGDTLIGSWGTYSADDGTVSFVGMTEYIAPQTQAAWLLVYDLASGAALGTYGAKIEKGTDVWGMGAVSGSGITATGAPVSGNESWVSPAAGSDDTYSTFAGGCAGGPGGAPLWPLAALAAGLWALRRRSKTEK